MQIISNYNQKKDSELMNLFYRSLFHERDEIEYVKEPNWVWRYGNNKKYIRIFSENGKVVASLGAVSQIVKLSGKKYRIATIVDNCIDPDRKSDFATIFGALFSKINKTLEKDGFDAEIFWDYEKNYQKNKHFFKNNGFTVIKNINWAIAGIEYNPNSPKKWRGKNKFITKIFYHLLKVSNNFSLKKITANKEKIEIKICENRDIAEISKFFLKQKPFNQIIPIYTAKELKDLEEKIGLKFIIAKKNTKIIGVLSYFISPWTGMMYGKPINEDWEKFYTITIDDFVVDEEFKETSTPSLMIEKAIAHRNQHPNIKIGLSGMIVDLVDKQDEFRKKLYSKYGFIEPSFDKGVFLLRKINPKFPVESVNSWHISNRTILAPIPKGNQ